MSNSGFPNVIRDVPAEQPVAEHVQESNIQARAWAELGTVLENLVLSSTSRPDHPDD